MARSDPVTIVGNAESWTHVDSRLVVLAYDVDGAHRWRWELDSEPADPAWPMGRAPRAELITVEVDLGFTRNFLLGMRQAAV